MAVLEMPPQIHDPLDDSPGNRTLMREWFRKTNAILKAMIRDGTLVGEGNNWTIAVPLASPSGLEYTAGSLRIDIDNAILQIATAGLGFSKAAINTVLSGPGSGSSDTPTFRALVDADIPAAIARDAEVAAGYQPLDADLTAIAALATTAYGRSLLTLASAAADRVLPLRVVTAAGGVTMVATDYFVIINKTVGAATAVTLPATPTAGQPFCIKDGKGDGAANNITLTPAAGTIDGAATLVMATNYQAVRIVHNGTEWNAA